MIKTDAFRLGAGFSLALASFAASAHVGVANLQTPFAREAVYQAVLVVPHGCAYTPAGGAATELDTYRVEVTTPPTFTGPRPVPDGVFGLPIRTVNGDGSVTFVWTKPASLDTPGLDDTMSYRIVIQGSFLATTATTEGARFTAQRFNTKQSCKNPQRGLPDVVVDWSNYGTPAANESPVIRVYPNRQPGWNSYTVPARVAATLTTPAAVGAFVQAFFADAQVVWVGKAGYSPNTLIAAKIQALAARDANYSELVKKSSLSATETLWVKY